MLEEQLVNSLPAFLQGSKISFDFKEIRTDLKSFLQNQSQFSDYNFDASGISFILDILAYNAQMHAMTTHLGLNEAFLQSAQARSNVVSAANLLGYLPQSVSSATASVNVTINPNISSVPTFFELEAGTIFSGGGLDWYSVESQTAEFAEDGKYYFFNVNLRQGNKKTVKYFYDNNIDYQKFEIPDSDVDISTLTVSVKESDSSTFIQPYLRFSTFNEITDATPIYFIQENSLGRYEIYFLNNGVGIYPKHGAIVELTYHHSNGVRGNGTTVFSLNTNLFNSGESIRITTVQRASGGNNRETIESIRHTAPYHYQNQNRCVTSRDYTSVIVENMPGVVESITTWGGEYNTPPEFGRVFISIKPVGGDKLTDEQKQYIISNIVKPKNVATITPFIKDPEFIWVGLDIIVKYDKSKTINSKAKIENLVRNTVTKYNETYLQQFSGILKHSRLLNAIDKTELSIQNSAARIYLIKKLTPNPSILNQFLINVPSDLYQSENEESLISSSPIVIDGRQYFLEDVPITGDVSRRRVQLIYYDTYNNKTIAVNSIGSINLDEKQMYLFNLKPDTSSVINIYFNPNSYDIVPFQNQFLRIDPNEIKITAENDPFSVTGIGSFDGYIPAPRNR